MARPVMLVIAGPPGGGKSSVFPLTAFGQDAFNIDDRCAQLVGSYRRAQCGARWRASASGSCANTLSKGKPSRSKPRYGRAPRWPRRPKRGTEVSRRSYASSAPALQTSTCDAFFSGRRPEAMPHRKGRSGRRTRRASRTFGTLCTFSSELASTIRPRTGFAQDSSRTRFWGESRWQVTRPVGSCGSWPARRRRAGQARADDPLTDFRAVARGKEPPR